MINNVKVKVIGASERQGRLLLHLLVIGPHDSWYRYPIVLVPADILPLRVIESLAYHAEMREGTPAEETPLPGL